MTLDIFEFLNNLRTNPAATWALLGATAQANTANFVNSLPAFIWSNALGSAALEFVNKKGVTGAANETSIHLTAWNMYAATICGRYEKSISHPWNSQAGWNAITFMDAVFANNLINNAGLYNGNLTHVGLACSCSSSSGAICGMIFTHTYIGFEVLEPKPKFLPYTP